MACATLHFHSPALVKACAMTVLVPEGSVGTPPFPVCYLLHGLSDDHTSWARQTSLERHVAGLRLIVVMPDGGRGFYCDAVDGPAYEPGSFSFRTWGCTTGGKRVKGLVPRGALLPRHAPHEPKPFTQVD